MQAALCQSGGTTARMGTPPGNVADCPSTLVHPRLQQRRGAWDAVSALRARRLSGSTASTSGGCSYGHAHRRPVLWCAVGDSGEDVVELTYSAEVMPPGGATVCSREPVVAWAVRSA